VEEAEADAPDLSGVGVLAPECAAAGRAEALRPAVARRVLAHELLAGEQPERAGRKPCLRRGGGAGSALAARAMAVPSALGLLGDLEADTAAQAVPRVRRAHCSSGDGGIRVSPLTPSIRSATSST